MKDNYKGENLKFYVNTDEEREQLYDRAKELGYEIEPILPPASLVYLNNTQHGYSLSAHYLEEFALCEYPQLTVEEFLYPRKGEMVEVSDYDDGWARMELYADLGEDAPKGLRYMTSGGACWRYMRPIKKEPQNTEPPNKEGFEGVVELLEEAIKQLKG